MSSISVRYWYQRLSGAQAAPPSLGEAEAKPVLCRWSDAAERLLAERVAGDIREAAIVAAAGLHALYRRFGWDRAVMAVHPALHSPGEAGTGPIFLDPAEFRGEDLDGLAASVAEAWERGLAHRHYDEAVLGRWLAANDLPAIESLASIEFAPAGFSSGAAVALGESAAQLRLNVRGDHGAPRRVGPIAASLPRLLEAALGDPTRALRSIPLVGEEEIASRGGYGRAAKEPAAPSPALDEAFASAALRHADRIAVIVDGGALTYAELDRASNAVARCLRDRFGVGPGDGVALMLEKSLHLPTAIIGVLKAGAAYIPVEPASPRKRAARMLTDSGAKLLLSHAALIADGAVPSEAGVPAATIEDAIAGDAQPLPPVRTPASAAYVMYTSGSTGEPKGVIVQDGPVVELAYSMEAVPVEPGERVLQALPYSFDPSVADIFGALLKGGTVCLIGAERLVDLDALAAFVDEHGITIGNLNTALVNTIAESKPDLIGAFTWLCSGGERTFPSQVERALAHLRPGATLAHVYGPTEATVIATVQNLGPEHCSGSIVPIGRPLRGTTVRVLDAEGMDAPAGVEGELYIGGNRLALGYAGDADLTRSRFVELEVPGQGRERFYRTGDMVRFAQSDRIEFIGRADKQLKIRGRRVELGEVESAVSQVPGVAAVHVEPQQHADGSSFLVAYYQAADAVDQDTMRTVLSDLLPEHMMPAAFAQMERLPLNQSGKVDRAALPDWRRSAEEADGRPATPMERRVAAIWQEELGLDTLGKTDDFFSLGGDSLKAIPIIKRVAEETGLELQIRDLFDHPSVAELADAIEAWLADAGAVPDTDGGSDAAAGGAGHAAAGRGEAERQETRREDERGPCSGLVDANGVKLHFLDWGGEGESLLCLPGLSHTAYIFEDLARHFAGRFRVVALTRRGHGESDAPPSGYDTETLAADIAALLDQVGIAKAHILGHSMAGQEMTRFAELHPDWVRSLIYLDAAYDRSAMLEVEDWSPVRIAEPAALRSWDSLRAWYEQQFGFWSEALQRDMLARYRDAGDGLSPVMGRMTGTSLLDGTIRSSPRFDRVAAPALLLYAAPEPDAPLSGPTGRPTYSGWSRAQIADVPARFANARVVEMAGAHHFLFIERETAVIREIAAFFDSLVQGP